MRVKPRELKGGLQRVLTGLKSKVFTLAHAGLADLHKFVRAARCGPE